MAKSRRGKRPSPRKAAGDPRSRDERSATWRVHPSLLAIGLVVLAASRPVSCEDYWWQNARGRAVLQGEFAPSQAMLSEDKSAEADWLGGVPQYLLHVAGGFCAATLGRVVMVLLAVAVLRPGRFDRVRSGWFAAAGVTILFCCEPALMLAGRGWDLLGTATLWTLISLPGVAGPGKGRPWIRLTMFAVLAVAWSNLGPLLAVSPFIALLWRPRTKPASSLLPAYEMSALVLGGCLNPRGPWAWRDSLMLMVPWFFETPFTLTDTLFDGPVWSDIRTLGFLVGIVVVPVVAAARRSLTIRSAIACGFCAVLGLTSSFTLPLASLLLGLLLRTGSNAMAADITEATAKTSKPMQQVAAWSIAGGLTLALLLGYDQGGGLGWGLSTRLEPRLFANATKDLPGGGVFAWDDRSVGIASWTRRDLRCLDTQQRALLGGRLSEWRLVLDDLRDQRRNRYQRRDGSWGGWWLWLQQRSEPVYWFAVSAEDTRTMGAMEATAFRPLSIDSPVIPYGASMNPAFARAILGVMQLRATVDQGDWTYSRPYHGGLHVGLRMGKPGDVELRLQQARVFRAMRLPMAALRVLGPRDPRFRDEQWACHLDLADRELRVMGAPSAWRQAILAELRQSSAAADESDDGGIEYAAAARAYARQSAVAAMELLDQTSSAGDRYAVGQLLLERGMASEARKEFQRIVDQHPDSIHSQGARDALRSL